jgi:signal transduction histidine kinase
VSVDQVDLLRLPSETGGLLSLLTQVQWFNRLRVVVAASVVWLTALATHALDLVAHPTPLYMLGGALFAIDCVYFAIYPSLARRPLPAVRRHVYLQIGVDLVVLTGLLHFAGGITNPLALFYLFHAFLAALALSTGAGAIVAVASLALLTLLGASERLGWLPHHPLPLGLFDLFAIEPLGFWLLWFAYAVTLAFSVYFLATIVDRLRRNERQLVRLGRHLALSEKLASVGTLAAGVSHEINNPIGVITNKVQILRYRISDGDARERLLAELDVIDKHVRRIAKITAGLLTFSRETPFELRPLDLGDLLREAADLVKVPFRTAEVDLQLASPAMPMPIVLGSANHLLQVLINILLNAKDASPRGGVVEMHAAVLGDEAAIEIVDHGHGIDPQHLPKIFLPFFTTKDVDKGTGLGLAISHGIVERHDGRLEVESEPGRGTTFRVVLPARRDA